MFRVFWNILKYTSQIRFILFSELFIVNSTSSGSERSHIDLFLSIYFLLWKYKYKQKKLSKSNNRNHENVTTVLFCYQNDLNIKTNESWLSFRHHYLYTWSLSLLLRLVITNVVENISLIFKFVYSLKSICKMIFYIHKRWLKEIIKKYYHKSFSKNKWKKINKKR